MSNYWEDVDPDRAADEYVKGHADVIRQHAQAAVLDVVRQVAAQSAGQSQAVIRSRLEDALVEIGMATTDSWLDLASEGIAEGRDVSGEVQFR